ncbi:ROK family protein [Paenibacillus flagellatus]|uniref:ROK family protein n=1 Tax=Paenibacillus flagellatus TaxID=2211139 RepID=A0A2V5KSN1_9BACL|nr:ROK family protein [Paenibacillus flagellatus]PYI52056.1 ROK family protein [Paenibacillus flagellatus]
MSHFIGVDIGGTNIVFGLLDDELNLLRKSKKPTGAANGVDYVLNLIASTIDELLAEQGLSRADLGAVGMGNPGFVDPERGVALSSANLKWENVPVAEKLGGLLGGIPVFIDNDVKMYTYGEAARGAGRGYKHVLGVTLGTGIAAAMVNEGKLYYGSGFLAGELGHVPMEGESALCGCGMRGCLETIASATGIARIARERLERGEASVLGEWFPGERIRDITAADVSRAYDAGDALAADVLRFVGVKLAIGLAWAITLWSPDVVVIGGGAANAGERLLAPMREALMPLILPMYRNRVVIKPAEMNDDAGVVGSAAFARSRAGL